MKTISLELPIDELDLDFEHQPYQRQTLEQEGIAESTTLVSCKFRGVEIIDLLDQGDIEQLSDSAFEKWRDADLDNKIQAYEDRKNNL